MTANDSYYDNIIFSMHEGCFWNKDFGWTPYIEEATTFTDKGKEEFNLPVGGEWVKKKHFE